MKKVNYKDIAQSIEDDVQKLGESAVCYQTASHVAVDAQSDSQYLFMHDFVFSNYDKKEAQELEAKNFMIGMPFEYDTIESAKDWERIANEAEASGIATDRDVERVFQRWHNL